MGTGELSVIPAGLWHTTITKPGTRLALVEDPGTGAANSDVRVLSEDSSAGRIVIFEVEENPVVRQISITGNESVDSDKIRDALTLTTGSTLDYPLLFENRGRIEGLYR
jgi:hypothetical protein